MRKLLVALIVLAPLYAPHLALSAFDAGDVSGSTGLSDTATSAYGSEYASRADNQDLGSFIGGRILAPAFSLVGVLFFVLMVYGGFLWMTAQGNPKQVDKAKDIIIAAVIGAVVVASAYVLTTTVLNAITSGSVTATTGG